MNDWDLRALAEKPLTPYPSVIEGHLSNMETLLARLVLLVEAALVRDEPATRLTPEATDV